MKKCQNCGFENEDVSLFCSECGTKLEEKVEKEIQRFCQHCGSAVEPGHLFCAECGKPLLVQEEKSLESKIVEQVAQEVKPVVKKAVPTPAPTPTPVTPTAAPVKEEAPVEKKKNIVPVIIIVVILAVALGVGIFFVLQSGILGGKDSEDDTRVEENLDDDEEKDSEADSETESELTEVEDSETVAEVDTTNPIPLVASVTASSYLNDTYSVAALTDSDASTAWAEGVGGFGVGESITYTLSADADVYGIAILPGDMTSSVNFYTNAYPIEMEVSNGDISRIVSISYYTPTFDFSGNPYMFYPFSEPLHGDNITITINGVKEGSSGQITCITELHLFTYAEEGSNVAVDPNAWTVTAGVVTDGDYILPTSNSAYLTMEDLEGLTAEQCRLARNELYARYGRKFTDETLKAYFESKSWYVGTIEPEDFTEDMLNEYEIYNRDLIVDYEEQNGFR